MSVLQGGMVQEIAALGLERDELGRTFGGARIGGENIPYEPRELGGIITTIRQHNVRRYLAVEGVSSGGWRYIKQACEIPDVTSILPSQATQPFCKDLRTLTDAFGLVSLDTRNLPISAEDVWKFIIGGKETQAGFGKGAPRDYGTPKLKPGSLVIFNFADPACKDLYFKVRTMDNKAHQSAFAGMIKWA